MSHSIRRQKEGGILTTMMIFLAALILPVVHGGTIALPSQTAFTAVTHEDRPGLRPTASAVYAPLPKHNLFRRQENTDLTDPHICGWIDGASWEPLRCGNAQESTICGYPSSAVRCCTYPYGNDCTAITSCLSYLDPQNGNTGSDVVTATASGVISCPMALSVCTTVSLFQFGGESVTYLSYGCGRSSTVKLAYQMINDALTSTTPSSSMPQNTDPSTSASSATSTSTGSSTNVGAIAGGTVGGVVVLAAIGAGIGYMVYRKRQQRKAATREVSQYTELSKVGGPAQQ